jgi:hypothetical protein
VSTLFLDFDGVTHPDPCGKDQYFCQLTLIEAVLRQYKSVDIVISSTWRFDHGLRELRKYFADDIAPRVIDVTPTLKRNDDTEGWAPHLLQHHREWECRKWLRLHKPSGAAWLAIDDCADWFTPQCLHLLTTPSTSGFTVEHADALSRMLLQLCDSV